MMLEEFFHSLNFKDVASFKKVIKDPVYTGTALTLILLLIGGYLIRLKSAELMSLRVREKGTMEQIANKEKSIALLTAEVKRINATNRKKSLSDGNLTANERKMSSVLEKMALSAAGKSVEMVSFRPESIVEEEKDNLLTVKVRVKSRFNELQNYISRLRHLPSPVKIDWIKIDTLENEAPMIYADLRVMTRLMKEKNEK